VTLIDTVATYTTRWRRPNSILFWRYRIRISAGLLTMLTAVLLFSKSLSKFKRPVLPPFKTLAASMNFQCHWTLHSVCSRWSSVAVYSTMNPPLTMSSVGCVIWLRIRTS